jgi:hypothetical protein
MIEVTGVQEGVLFLAGQVCLTLVDREAHTGIRWARGHWIVRRFQCTVNIGGISEAKFLCGAFERSGETEIGGSPIHYFGSPPLCSRFNPSGHIDTAYIHHRPIIPVSFTPIGQYLLSQCYFVFLPKNSGIDDRIASGIHCLMYPGPGDGMGARVLCGSVPEHFPVSVTAHEPPMDVWEIHVPGIDLDVQTPFHLGDAVPVFP